MRQGGRPNAELVDDAMQQVDRKRTGCHMFRAKCMRCPHARRRTLATDGASADLLRPDSPHNQAEHADKEREIWDMDRLLNTLSDAKTSNTRTRALP